MCDLSSDQRDLHMLNLALEDGVVVMSMSAG